MVLFRHICLFSTLLVMLTSGSVSADSPDPAQLSSIDENGRTQVLILATPHLTELGDDLNPEAIDPLINRLRSFAPDAVAVEALRPSVIRAMQAQGETFAPVLTRFAGSTLEWGKRAREALGLSDPELKAEISAMLTAGKEGPLNHGGLALRLLAMHDLPSAALQWAHLQAEGKSGTGDVPDEIAEFLSERLKSPNEIYAVAIPLARRLGHARIASIDDHSDKDEFLPIMEQLGAEIADHELTAEVTSATIYQDARKILASSNRQGDLTPAYRFYNSAVYAREDIRLQWDIFLRTRLESRLDRTRLALWDVRNLLIAAHIRRVTARHPGGRVLVIIGASHKAFLEAFLKHAMDIRLVPAENVLGTGN